MIPIDESHTEFIELVASEFGEPAHRGTVGAGGGAIEPLPVVEPRLFHTNLVLIRTCGLEADYGSISSGEEHFYAWMTLYPADDPGRAGMNTEQQLVAGMLTRANLLQMLRTCTVFMDTDAGTRVKVVCRYQQFRAANKIAQRLRTGATALERSGVVCTWPGSRWCPCCSSMNWKAVPASHCRSPWPTKRRRCTSPRHWPL